MGTRRQPPATGKRQRKTAGSRGAKAAADELSKLAEDEGAVGSYGSAAARALRDAAILARLAAGATQKQAAAQFGLAERTVRAIAAGARATPSPLDERPMQVLEDLLRIYRRMAADFAVLAYANVDRNPSVTLGAMKMQLAALEAFVGLLDAVGFLPTDLSVIRAEGELLRLGDLILARLRDFEAGELSAHELAEWIRDVVMQPGPLPTVDREE
jgi:hypothetical protein